MCHALCWVLSNTSSLNSESGNKVFLSPDDISKKPRHREIKSLAEIIPRTKKGKGKRENKK